MDFTREPIIETVITPKEGFKIVVRSSKNVGQEEYFVDAVEVVSFGNAFFFRSLEKPKAFLVPVSDYEILEVREARIVLKNVGTDRSIKIGGGREASVKALKEQPYEKHEAVPAAAEAAAAPSGEGEGAGAEQGEASRPEGRGKRDRRRNYRRRRGREEEPREAAAATTEAPPAEEPFVGEDKEGKIILPPPEPGIEENPDNLKSNLLSSLLTPPPQLISETIERYKSNALFKGAFYERGQEEEGLMDIGEITAEESAETPITEMAWEYTPESEPPASPFTEEELPPPIQEDVDAEPSELPPENHRE